jgi:hypothetical protein
MRSLARRRDESKHGGGQAISRIGRTRASVGCGSSGVRSNSRSFSGFRSTRGAPWLRFRLHSAAHGGHTRVWARSEARLLPGHHKFVRDATIGAALKMAWLRDIANCSSCPRRSLQKSRTRKRASARCLQGFRPATRRAGRGSLDRPRASFCLGTGGAARPPPYESCAWPGKRVRR